MTEAKGELVIRPEGNCVFRKFVETDVPFPESILQRYASQVSLPVYDVVPAPEHLGVAAIHALVSQQNNSMTWLCRINTLHLKVPVRRDGNGIFTPAFAGRPEDTVALRWSPTMFAHTNLWLYYSTVTTLEDVRRVVSGKGFLFAIDCNTWHFYRLPLGNVFETCELCQGNFMSRETSHYGSLLRCLEQLSQSEWNADLINETRQRHTERLFRWVADRDAEGGWTQVEPQGDWLECSERVSVPFLSTLLPLIQGGL